MQGRPSSQLSGPRGQGRSTVVKDPEPQPEAQLRLEVDKVNSIHICDLLAREIVNKAGKKIQDKLLLKMRPEFVKKQMIIQSTESGLFGSNRVDRFAVTVEEADETEEPVAPATDNFQRETIKYRVI